MSLTLTTILPAWGGSLQLNYEDGSGNPIYPMEHFEITTAMDDVGDAKKMFAIGEWKKFRFPGAMTIVAEGHILGIQGATDADASIDYVSKRLALLNAIIPPYPYVPTSRVHGVFRVQMDGMSEAADAEISLDQHSIPLEADYPAISEYSITWKGFLPVFFGVSSGNPYYLG